MELHDIIGFSPPPRNILEMVGWVDIDTTEGVYITTQGPVALVIVTPPSLTPCILHRGEGAKSLKLTRVYYPYNVDAFAEKMAAIYPSLAPFYASIRDIYAQGHLYPQVTFLGVWYKGVTEARAAISRFSEYGAIPVRVDILEGALAALVPPSIVGIGRPVPVVGGEDTVWADLVARALSILHGGKK